MFVRRVMREDLIQTGYQLVFGQKLQCFPS
jgi:hypothetical protein